MPNLTAQIAAAVGGLLGMAVLFAIASWFFPSIRKNQKSTIITAVILAIAATIVFSFAEGKGGFDNRIAEIPSMKAIILYGTSALILTTIFLRNWLAVVTSLALTFGLHW